MPVFTKAGSDATVLAEHVAGIPQAGETGPVSHDRRAWISGRDSALSKVTKTAWMDRLTLDQRA
ncbi:MAG: hypothetical protein K5657_00680 [Desulfovibrio sp.]|nr:hypothetical protein [Desulfovibrio sp.]